MIYLSRVLVAANETQASQRAVDNSVGSNPPLVDPGTGIPCVVQLPETLEIGLAKHMWG